MIGSVSLTVAAVPPSLRFCVHRPSPLLSPPRPRASFSILFIPPLLLGGGLCLGVFDSLTDQRANPPAGPCTYPAVAAAVQVASQMFSAVASCDIVLF
ncbi:hypothetical protein BO94DRAFT_535559 [Aspergillus sclerotioniger CBS 115572]|uniref:Uncharacterized protein n=1 Tax=Aspergillus sclerotioniger CBS 115572 TaxID=1450535 RepID=A0A317WIX3_9EURO|nr:hypothetical protein BO94DRAFT_535559 [Aspergillus sclerotioniger CBS 115572]PWY86406.1 hypothetical protein BO94DRAFT_535559 [Aspergillus sclerotioniger CBS 115572]